MAKLQQGDVLIIDVGEGGDMVVENGLADMDGGLQNLAYFCLFGGNEKDLGGQDTTYQHWANLLELQEKNKLRSRTQSLIKQRPATSGNLLAIQAAAEQDLAVFLDENIATELTVVVSIPALNRLQIDVNIIANFEQISLRFVTNWESNI